MKGNVIYKIVALQTKHFTIRMSVYIYVRNINWFKVYLPSTNKQLFTFYLELIQIENVINTFTDFH